MRLPELNIGGLRARLPIVQGSMGIGISLSRLASAVAREGGVGFISGVQIGFRDPSFYSDPIKANLRAIGAEIKKARALAPGGILGMNFMTIQTHYEDYVREAARCGIDVISCGAGLPLSLPELVAGTKTRIMPIVSSVRACRLIVTRWIKKYDRLPDGVVVEGPKAGGHLGFPLDDLRAGTAQSLEDATQEVAAYIGALNAQYNVSIPVIAGGGILTHGDIAGMLALGAGGVQMGTAFAATEECDASEAFKLAYVSAKEEDVTLMLSPTGLAARAVHTPYLDRVSHGNTIAIDRCFQCMPTLCRPERAPYCLSQALIQSAEGEPGLVFCGARAGEITEITTVPRLMAALAGAPADRSA
ncbi:MAG: nitronate monooxygenase [Oscillospiraceae bacterium]|nr:nitronate monooxygenase [Oscillospiraceae bacterium]